MRTLFLSLMILFLYSPALSGQHSVLDVVERRWWVNLGVGQGNAGTDADQNIVFYGSFNKPQNRLLFFTGRASYAQEINIFEGADRQKFWDAGLLAGLYAKGDLAYVSISGGLGLTGGRGNAGPEGDNFVTIGVPLESQLFFTLPNLGVGLTGLLNLNPERTFWGAMLTLQFGELR